MTKLLTLLFAGTLGLLIGCGSTLKPVVLDQNTRRFPTQTVLGSDATKVKKPLDPKLTKLAYIKSDAKSTTQYHQFFKSCVETMKKFDKVSDKEDFETLIIQKNLGSKVSNVSDLVGLHNLAQEIGPFLVIEPNAVHKGGYNYEADLKAINPTTGETLLHLHHAAFNWSGLDEPLFYPLMNAFLDWLNEQPAAPSPATAPKDPKPATP